MTIDTKHISAKLRDISEEARRRALSGSVADFSVPEGIELIDRKQGFFDWQHNRRLTGVWSYGYSIDNTPMPEMRVRSELGDEVFGVNFASQDYLCLTSHETVVDAAIEAIREYGPHSAGSPALQGNTFLMGQLKGELGSALAAEEVVLFPTGWAAGFGTVVGLVRPNDHICIDQLAHNCLVVGAASATNHVYRFKHNSEDSLRSRLRRIRKKDTENAILVITEGIFSMDSDAPDLSKFQELCREYNATLLVDVAHDFGSMGKNGGGVIEMQAMVGEIDIVVGSFSKTFASNGGFAAVRNRHLAEYLKYYASPHIFSNAISPIQCAIVLASLRVVRSKEGAQRRSDLFGIVEYLRDRLSARGAECIGKTSPIIPVAVGNNESLARVTAALAFRNGLFANLVEFPAVPVGRPRFRMQAMATHTRAHADRAISVLLDCMEAAEGLLESDCVAD